MTKYNGVKISSIRKQYLRSNQIAFNDKYISKSKVELVNNTSNVKPYIPIPTENSNVLKINFKNNGSAVTISTMTNGVYVDTTLNENKMYYISSDNKNGNIYFKLNSTSNFIVCGDKQGSSNNLMFSLTKGEYTDLLIISNKYPQTQAPISSTTPSTTTPDTTTPWITTKHS